MTKHTKGEWKAIEKKYEGWVVVLNERIPIGTTYIARDINQGHDGGEADAKLIAAAPELLNALQEIFKYTKGSPIGSKEYQIHMLCYNAIKKATE